MIHEHAGELVSDCAVHERCGHGRIDSTRQTTDDLCVTDLLTNRSDLLVDDVPCVPIGFDAGAIMQEILDQILSQRRVLDLRMPLHAVELA